MPLLVNADRKSWSGLATASGAVAKARRANTVVGNPPIANFMIGPVHRGCLPRSSAGAIHDGVPKQLISERFRVNAALRPGDRPQRRRQATLTSTSWMPAPDGATLASPLPAGDRARSVHVPGAAK